MANPAYTITNDSERDIQRDGDLHLDKVVASQPEIGPTPPDGGYGWLIVASAIVYHITIPGLLVMYGLIILKSTKDEDHDVEESMKIWDVDIALVPVVMVVIRLLLESWCRTVVKLFNMPRFMALAGLCLTVAGVLLSSYSTNANTNDHIINIFAGFFAGAGCALTGQQADIIVTHFFRDKLNIAQRLIRMAPSIGNCIIPILIGYLCSTYTSDVVVMIYAAILMQNCLFLASFARPIYIEKVLKSTYKMLRDAVEDEDEVIFSNNSSVGSSNNREPATNAEAPHTGATNNVHVDDGDDSIVVFNYKNNAKEILDPSVELRENRPHISKTSRFSSDFNTFYTEERTPENRFSSDFGNFDGFRAYPGVNAYQELENIDRVSQQPQPLYRETTVHTEATQNSVSYAVDPNTMAGTARRTASLKKHFISVINMLKDINFYLYTLLHLSTNYSIVILGIIFPPLIYEHNPTLNTWKVSVMVSLTHSAAFCFVMLCGILPKSLYEKFRLCALFCMMGAIGFFGISLTTTKSFLVVWGIFASFSTSAANIVQQPLYNNVLSEFDTTATITTANTIVATFIMIWSITYNYEYKTCFFTASILQSLTCLVFSASSFRRQRR